MPIEVENVALHQHIGAVVHIDSVAIAANVLIVMDVIVVDFDRGRELLRWISFVGEHDRRPAPTPDIHVADVDANVILNIDTVLQVVVAFRANVAVAGHVHVDVGPQSDGPRRIGRLAQGLDHESAPGRSAVLDVDDSCNSYADRRDAKRDVSGWYRHCEHKITARHGTDVFAAGERNGHTIEQQSCQCCGAGWRNMDRPAQCALSVRVGQAVRRWVSGKGGQRLIGARLGPLLARRPITRINRRGVDRREPKRRYRRGQQPADAPRSRQSQPDSVGHGSRSRL